MKVAVRYFSRGGNTKKLADAIAGAAGAQAQTVAQPLEERVDLLFLGASVYAGGVDGGVEAFIAGLSPADVGEVAVFSTAAIKTSSYPQVKKLLEAKGIRVSDREFHCRGQFTLMHRGRPNAEDQKEAEAFARQLMG